MSEEHGPDSLVQRLAELRERHSHLDEEIRSLETFAFQDQLLIRRLKKEKLRLKDAIARTRTLLIPDLDA